VKEYVDHGTGSKGVEGRDQLAQLMEDASRKRFEMVLVFSLDRFTREGVLKAFQYVERLTAAGVQFRSVTEEQFQTSGPAGELFMAVAAWMAKQERTQLRNRINAGLDRARAAGKILGRKPAGLDLTKMERLRAEGLSIRQIATVMKSSRSSVQRSFRRARKLKVIEIQKAG
jgi:DNA invertase Pin-like site-specific DNA recombinase